MTLIIPDPRFEAPELFYPRRKPVGRVRVNKDHWAYKLANHFYLPKNAAFVKDMIGKQDLVTSGCTFTQNTLNSSDAGHMGSITYDNLGAGFMLLHMSWQETYNTGPHYIYNPTVTFHVIRIHYDQFGTPTNQFTLSGRGDGSTTESTSTGPSIPASTDLAKSFVYLFNWRFTDVLDIWINGVKVASAASTTLAAVSGATGNLMPDTKANLYSAMMGGAKLSDAQARSLSMNPYQILVPA